MLSVRDQRRVAWRRSRAANHYLGYVTVTDEVIRLAGHETANGIHVMLSIPRAAVRAVRLGARPDEQVAAGDAIVIDLAADDDSILVRPVEAGTLELDTLARRLSAAADRDAPCSPRASNRPAGPARGHT